MNYTTILLIASVATAHGSDVPYGNKRHASERFVKRPLRAIISVWKKPSEHEVVQTTLPWKRQVALAVAPIVFAMFTILTIMACAPTVCTAESESSKWSEW